MDISQLNPFVRFIDKRYSSSPYSNFLLAYDHRLLYISSGNGTVYIKNSTHPLSENEAVIIPPATKYKFEFEKNTEFYILNFDFIYKHENTNIPPTPPQTITLFNTKKIISAESCDIFPLYLSCENNSKNIFQSIYDAYIKKPIFYNELISAKLKDFIISSLIFTEYDKTPELVKNIITYINNNYLDNITNSTIADYFSYHPNYINRIFKKYIGKTIHAYIIELRLQKAKQLILTTSSSISHISEACAFASYAYFIKSFRNFYGISPLKYRKQNSLHL